MSKKKNSIIFLGISYEKSKSFKTSLAPYKFLKTYNSNHIDEARQIIEMSEKVAIVTDNNMTTEALDKYSLDDAKGRFKIFFIDWDFLLSKEKAESYKASNIIVIKAKDFNPVMERLEFYFYGKTNIFNQMGFVNPDQRIHLTDRKGFFTLLELVDCKWRVVISKHA